MTPGEVTLAVIAKTPVPGRVKTRLCPPCTGEQAASIAEAALRDTLDAVAATSAGRRAVVLDGDRPAWIGPEFEVIGQRGDGLDERLGAAFVDLDAPVVIIGMDTPQVTSDLLDQVIATLCRGGVDAVLGPANDGGYWVVGLRTPTPSAVEGVPMSVGWTCAAQLDRLDSLGLRTALVQELTDLDTFDEAIEVASIARGRRFPAAVLAARSAIGTPSDTSGVPPRRGHDVCDRDRFGRSD